ncbi:glutamate racemase [Ammoniphilus oxalaticus]|uniref:Glutamate racemase n=1 Tax=Ammoniphilus oxalaticus TaxID=66863 RepID=A0A419SIM0_9BACL|nr:glutamate racemase [Ammoniphilus oxalaticus]RKD23853.1 glutamate racemase [Ammoniphilus oxalaticus]
MRIGVIDSGVGGLTVAHEIMRQLPQEPLMYFGDTARCPYGPRPAEEVRTFTMQMIAHLAQQRMKALVIACNTATAVVLREISQVAPIPIIGVIDPGARTAIKETKSGVIGVIGTEGTIRSGAYEQALKRINPNVKVYSLACPELAPFVEAGISNEREAYEIAQRSLSSFKGVPIDTLILGCTHYPLLSKYIRAVIGEQVKLISSAEETARELSVVLDYKGLLASQNQPAVPLQHKFFVSGNSTVMEQIARTFLNAPLDLEQVNLANQTVCTLPWTNS